MLCPVLLKVFSCGVVGSANGEGVGGVWIHQISRRHSQAPFRKVKGAVQLVLFHPTKPQFFVAVRSSFLSGAVRVTHYLRYR